MSDGHLARGVLPAVILLAVEDGAVTGAAIISWIARATGGQYVPGPGSMYSRLTSLHHRGLLWRHGPPGRPEYVLTALGRRQTCAGRGDALHALGLLRGPGTSPGPSDP